MPIEERGDNVVQIAGSGKRPPIHLDDAVTAAETLAATAREVANVLRTRDRIPALTEYLDADLMPQLEAAITAMREVIGR